MDLSAKQRAVPKYDWCVFQWKDGKQTLTFPHTILFWSFFFSTWNRADSFCCCRNNGQKPHHLDQNSLTFTLRRSLSKQALALFTYVLDFFIYTSQNSLRNDFCAALGQHPHLGDSDETFPILEGTRLSVGASHIHPELRRNDQGELDCRCSSSLVILPKYGLFGF